MKFETPLLEGRFVRRYQRFLSEFELADGRRVVAHCANPGSMKSCLQPGAQSWLSLHDSPRRKLAYTWEIVELSGARVFVNPVRVNDVVHEALLRQRVPWLAGYDVIEREVRFGRASRADFRLTRGENWCIVEVKSVTLQLGKGRCAFPDAVTERGRRHLEELIRVRAQGGRAVMLYCASRTDAKSVEPADAIDPAYGRAMREALRRGVEMIAYRASITPHQVRLLREIPVRLERLP